MSGYQCYYYTVWGKVTSANNIDSLQVQWDSSDYYTIPVLLVLLTKDTN